jgi:hypothetical protein
MSRYITWTYDLNFALGPELFCTRALNLRERDRMYLEVNGGIQSRGANQTNEA